MTKKVIIVHGWSGSPISDWYPWAKEKLGEMGYEVIVPAMPYPDSPKIAAWVEKLKDTVSKIDEDTVLIGHSIGCQTILRFLERLPEGQKVGKVIMVAPWMSLTKEATPSVEEVEIAKPWQETPIDFTRVKTHSDSFTVIFSDNDPYVPLEGNRSIFEEGLGARILVDKNRGHFSQDDGVKELPVILEALQFYPFSLPVSMSHRAN